MIDMAKKLFQKKSQEDTPMIESAQASTEAAQVAQPSSSRSELTQTAVTYYKNEVNGRWTLVTLKYNPLTGEAKVESLSDEDVSKEVLRERFIILNAEAGLL